MERSHVLIRLIEEWGMRMHAFCRKAFKDDREKAKEITSELFIAYVTEYGIFDGAIDGEEVEERMYHLVEQLCREHLKRLVGKDNSTSRDWENCRIHAEVVHSIRQGSFKS